MDNTAFALIVAVMNAPGFALLIKGWLDHRKWQKQNVKWNSDLVEFRS